MVRNHSNITSERHERKFGAEGFITVRNLIRSDGELNGKGRVLAHTTVTPGSGIGYHIHTGETEIYYIYSGKGLFNDNGTEVEVGPGDVTFTPSGHGHALRCVGEAPLEIIAVILYS